MHKERPNARFKSDKVIIEFLFFFQEKVKGK